MDLLATAKLIDMLKEKGVTQFKNKDIEIILEPEMNMSSGAPAFPLLDDLKDDTSAPEKDEKPETDYDRHSLLSRL